MAQGYLFMVFSMYIVHTIEAVCSASKQGESVRTFIVFACIGEFICGYLYILVDFKKLFLDFLVIPVHKDMGLRGPTIIPSDCCSFLSLWECCQALLY